MARDGLGGNIARDFLRAMAFPGLVTDKVLHGVDDFLTPAIADGDVNDDALITLGCLRCKAHALGDLSR